MLRGGYFQELCKDIDGVQYRVRDGVFLEESAIPYIPIRPHDTSTEFNVHLFGLFKYGSVKVLVRDDGIKQADIWFHLKDFSLILKAILTSLKSVVSAEDDYDVEGLGENDDNLDDTGGTLEEDKGKVADSWDDDSEESDSESIDSTTASTSEVPQVKFDKKGVDAGL
ncbi:hypothetical protein BKA59DRAFT_448441 [Fusarium tricinctum]|uniref:Uncharacterized protein n=1 Tax=Fusarium tricinctum TaxID=61284 RepID=A0A8K0WHD6_9HYPO|nr:hypothetical protein BKA59DRAFT_448441 [Fusarium tricinctum]